MRQILLKITLIISISFIFFQHIQAQTVDSNPQSSLFNKKQDSLVLLSDSIYRIKNDIERIAMNGIFVKQFINVLKIKHSFNFNFDSLRNLSILKPRDKSFRIITWSLAMNNGTYRFYGAVQHNTKDGSLKLTPLIDQTIITKDENAILTAKQWIGARYYEIIPIVMTGSPSYYLLLGWKGNNSKTNKKVIEILSFNKGEAVFGKPVLETVKKMPLKNRQIFEYNKNNSMSLFYDKNNNLIVFDHLAPINPEMKGNFEYYGSDLTFDAYTLGYGKQSIREDVQLKNELTNSDEQFVNPTKASKLIQKPKR